MYFALIKEKRPLFHFLLSRSPSLLGGLCAIVGDFNTVLHGIDETGATFAEDRSFQEPVTLGWLDAWRKVNGSAREYSWFSQRGNGFRIDHALCPPRLAGTVVSARYKHAYREQGISDHSPLIVDFSAASALRLES